MAKRLKRDETNVCERRDANITEAKVRLSWFKKNNAEKVSLGAASIMAPR